MELVGGTARLDALSEKLTHIRISQNGLTARCPAHDDRRNSLSVTQAADGRILIKCHAGCDTRDVLGALGMSYADLFPPAGGGQVSISSKRRAREAAVYRYVDEAGELLFEVVRTEPKGFFQRRPDGNGGFRNGLGDVRRVLYRLDLVAEAVAQGRTVVLCEGEKDADAINALAPETPVAATTAPMGAGKWRESYTAALAGADVVICPDNDNAGQAHLRAVGEALLVAGCRVRVADVVRAEPSLARVKGADVSDYLALAKDRAQALAGLLKTAVPFVAAASFDGTDAYLLGDFLLESARAAQSPPLRTGFPALDEKLGGRFFPGLYVLGSLSGVGKTALAAQLALNIAAQGRRVLFFSLEMSRAEMTARCVLNLLFAKDAPAYGALRVGDLLYGARDAQTDAAIRALAAEPALRNLSFIEGGLSLDAAEISRRAHEHIKSFGEAPVVIVDYLQMLAPPNAAPFGIGDKQSVDANVLALKRVSRECDAPVLAISSFNRQSYAASASYSAFKESGAIEYAADVVLALQARGAFALTEKADPAREIERLAATTRAKDVRPLELVMLKNRRGPGHAVVELEFYAGSFYFAGEAGGRRGNDGGPPAANFFEKKLDKKL